MNPYSESIKRAFRKIKNSNSSKLDSSISEMMQILDDIDDGNFLIKIKGVFHIENIESWIEENRYKGFYSYGIKFPDDNGQRLSVLSQIFMYIWEDLKAMDFILKYYESTMSYLSRGVIGILSLLSFNQKTIERSNKMHIDRENQSILKFHEDITRDFESLLLTKIEFEYQTLNKIIMGDNFEHITNSTVINKSYLQNVMNKYADNEELKSALNKIEEIVLKSDNKDAVEAFNNFNEELQQSTPSKSKLKSFWQMLTSNLPSIKDLADITIKLTQLFL